QTLELGREMSFLPKADIAHGFAGRKCDEPKANARSVPYRTMKCLAELRADRSADEHDLARRSGLKNLPVCARRLDEWQFLANNAPQSPVFKACKEPGVDVRLFGCRNDPERERPNRSATPHQFTGIDGDLAATADHDDTAIVGQKLRVVGEIHVSE